MSDIRPRWAPDADMEPGVVPMPLWRPPPEEADRAKVSPERYASYAAVAVQPGVAG